MGYLNSWATVVEGAVQGWKGIGRVEVHKVYEIFLPGDVYAAQRAYRWGKLVERSL